MLPPPSDPATDMRAKRDEAISQARELYGHPAPAPNPTSFSSLIPNCTPPGAPGKFSSFLLCFKYLFMMGRVIFLGQLTNKFILIVQNIMPTPPTNLPGHNGSQPSCILSFDQRRQCSSQGKSVLSLEITQQNLSIQCGFEMWYHSKWACGQPSYVIVQPSYPLNPTLELQVSKKEPQEYFKSHIPFCCLGTCKGSMMNLILDYNAFHKHSLDEEECAFQPSPPQKIVFLGISKQILDPENLLWKLFETAVDSPTFHDHQDSFWINDICNELDPDGVKKIQGLCLYKFQYKDTIKTKETSKIINTSIYDSGIFYPMVA
ncbi:coiled coil AKL27, partial [Puccinia sorghi]